MSDNIPRVVTGEVPYDEMNEEEKLRVRKNCKSSLYFSFVATHADIPPPSPDLAKPVLGSSDEQCKPVNLPRPIFL